MTSPWSSGAADSSSIWNSNSPNLNLLRRYSLRTPAAGSHLQSGAASSCSAAAVAVAAAGAGAGAQSPGSGPTSQVSVSTAAAVAAQALVGLGPKSHCSWEPSADGKYLIGYLVISGQDLELYNAALGFQLCGGKPTKDAKFGAIVEHVVPGGLMNIVCKLKVGDEIVEWNGFSLRNKSNEEVCDIIEQSAKTASDCLRLVAVRSL